jgi:hypothetical protein
MKIELNSGNCKEATTEMFEQMAEGIRVVRKENPYNYRQMILVMTHDSEGWCTAMDVNDTDQKRMVKQGLSPEIDAHVIKYYRSTVLIINK